MADSRKGETFASGRENTVSDIRAGSAECRLSRTPRNDEEREKAAAAAWHRHGVVMVDLNEQLPFEVRETVTYWATRRWGQRRVTKSDNGGIE